jgi:hypothetical protein
LAIVKGVEVFTVFNNKGFSIDFANGYRVTASFGSGDLSTQPHDSNIIAFTPAEYFDCVDAQLSVFHEDSNALPLEDFLPGVVGTKLGWASPELLATLLKAVAILPERVGYYVN